MSVTNHGKNEGAASESHFQQVMLTGLDDDGNSAVVVKYSSSSSAKNG